MISKFFVSALFLAVSASAFALDIKPYTAQALSAEQQAGKQRSQWAHGSTSQHMADDEHRGEPARHERQRRHQRA